MKKKIKIIIDMIMYLCFIVLTGYHITNNLIHEILGTTVFVLFIAHNILNFKWYMTIFNGKHDAKRNFHILINFALLIAIILTIVSGVMMSKSLYTFIHVKGIVTISRTVHLIANAWSLVLVSIHLGLHLTPIIMKIRNKVKTSDFEYGVYIIVFVFLLLGIFFFIQSGIGKDMLGITKFKYFNYDENPIVFYLKYMVLSLTIAMITNLIVSKSIDKNEK